MVSNDPVYIRGSDPALTGQPRFLSGQPDEQTLVYYTHVVGPGTMENLQIAVAKVSPTEIQPQEVVNATSSASLHPSVDVDERGYVHVVWIDTAGFERYNVVYASNAPQIRQELNRITTYDVVDRILGTVINVFSALFFVPVVLSWLILPVAWLAVFSMVSGSADMDDPRALRAFVAAVILHLGAQLFLFPDLLSRFSLGDLLSPPTTELMGRWVVPVVLALVSVAAAWLWRKRVDSPSAFGSYVVFALADSILALLIYVALSIR